MENNNIEENEKKDQLVAHAEAEYAIISRIGDEKESKLSGKELEDAKADREYGELVHKAVIELIETFSKQGHSGMSAHFVLSEFNRLARFKTLTPLTGDDSEWEFAYENENGAKVEQNKRCPSVFRENGDNSTATFSGGKVFSDDDGKSWYANSHSTVKIEFPFDVPDEPERIMITSEEREKMEVEDMRALIKYIKDNPTALEDKYAGLKDKILKDIEEFYAKHPEEKEALNG